MIKTIPAKRLLPGMYVVDLKRGWLSHGFLRNSFLIRDEATLDRIHAEGIEEVLIDTSRGLDEPELPDWQPQPWEGLGIRDYHRATAPPISLAEERRRSVLLLRKLTALVKELMADAMLGRTVEAERLAPFIEKMIDSVARNPDGLLPLARLKSQDAYLQEHAAASAALIIALAVQQRLDKDAIYSLAMGALLQDIGQAKLGDHLVSRPSTLTRDEHQLVRQHVQESLSLLDKLSRVPTESKHLVLEHHERFDGSGYPYCLAGEKISLGGRMAAIVDTYDAMTSDRPYRRATNPGAALQEIYGDGGKKLDQRLVHSFVKAVGVYPVGTLVRLESGHLAVVQAQHGEDVSTPLVKVIYNGTHRHYVTPVLVDLSNRVGNHYGKILGIEDYYQWGLQPKGWEPA